MAKKLAMLFGIVFVLVGALGFISNPIVGEGGYFQTDMIHNAIHLVVGVLMLIMAGNMATLALNLFGAIYVLLGVIGFVQGGDKLLGLIVHNSHDTWLHLVLGLVLLAVGMSTKGSGSSMPSSGGMTGGMGGMPS